MLTKEIKYQLLIILLCFFAFSQSKAEKRISFSFSHAPTESRDHLIFSFPDLEELEPDTLTLAVQASTDFINWGTIDVIHFERSPANEVEGFVIDSELRATEGGFKSVWVKRKEIYASSFPILNNEALTYVSNSTNEIYIFIGNYTISEVGEFGLRTLEYTERTPANFFRIVTSSIEIED